MSVAQTHSSVEKSEDKTNSKTQVLGYGTNINAGDLLSATNQRRANAGAGALVTNSQLNQAAQAKANDMSTRNYWSHNTPDGTPPWAFIASAGYSYSRAGENLACGFNDSSAVVTGWYNSPTHRENMLATEYKDVGFGIINAPNYNCGDFPTSQQTIVVAMYGTPLNSASNPTESTPPVQSVAPTQTTPTQSVGADTTPAGANKKHTVTLTIVDANGRGAVGVTVTLHSDPQTGVTDKDGKVTFTDVETGKHTIIVEVAGAKSEIAVDLTSEPVQYSKTLAKPELTSNKVVASSKEKLPVAKPKQVSRLEVMASDHALELTWILAIAVLVAGGALLVKHSIAAHRFFVRGERYLLKHKYVDVAFIALLIALYLLTRKVGAIL